MEVVLDRKVRRGLGWIVAWRCGRGKGGVQDGIREIEEERR